MSVFTEKEREYLLSGVHLGRLAIVGFYGTPHVVPTAFRYNPGHDTIDIGGHDFAKRKKYRDVLKKPEGRLRRRRHRLGEPLACPRH